MNRRAFLSALAATFVIDPERALFVPGRKLISIPKPTPIRVSVASIVELHIDESFRLAIEQYDAVCKQLSGFHPAIYWINGDLRIPFRINGRAI